MPDSDLMPSYADPQAPAGAYVAGQDQGDGVDWRAVNQAVAAAISAKKAKALAEEQAIRFAGQKEYNELIQGGARPEEALQRTAEKIFYHNPEKQVAAQMRFKGPASIPQNIQATPVTTPGGDTLGYGVFDPSRGTLHSFARTPKATRPMVPPEIKVQIDTQKANLSAMRRELERQKKDMGIGDADAARKARILQEQISAGEKQLVDLARGNQPAAAASAGTPLPKSKADLKQGTIYQTPKGLFAWTGKGWAPAQAPAPATPEQPPAATPPDTEPDDTGDPSDAE